MNTFLIKFAFILSLMISFSSFSQAPEKFNYQAVIRNQNGVVVTNQLVSLQLEILEGSMTGVPVYTETFQSVSNDYGLVNLELGTGITVDNFATIDWGNGTYYVRTSIDASGGSNYTLMGTSQFLSIPYALYSKTSEYCNNDAVDDADNNPVNEIQDISLVGSNLSLSNGSTVDLSNVSPQMSPDEVDSIIANYGFLTNIPSFTQSILIPPSMISPSSFGTGVAYGNLSWLAGTTIEFSDSITGIVRFTLPMPSNWDGTPMSLKILYSSAGVSGDFSCAISTKGTAIGESLSQAINTSGLILPSLTVQNTLSEASMIINFNGQSAVPDLLNFSFRRIGTSPQDVSTDSLHILGFVLDYNTL